jgi:hypothetical protein
MCSVRDIAGGQSRYRIDSGKGKFDRPGGRDVIPVAKIKGVEL